MVLMMILKYIIIFGVIKRVYGFIIRGLKNISLEPLNILKGKLGEAKVRRIVKDISSDYRNSGYVNDILIGKLGKKTQIDHILFIGKDVYVIETKRLKYEVNGHLYREYWRNGKHHFYNPVMQNESHINALKGILKDKMLEELNFHNVVFFVNKRKKDLYVGSSKPYTYIVRNKRELKKIIKENGYTRTLNNNRKIIKFLKKEGKYKRSDLKRHIQRVKGLQNAYLN